VCTVNLTCIHRSQSLLGVLALLKLNISKALGDVGARIRRQLYRCDLAIAAKDFQQMLTIHVAR